MICAAAPRLPLRLAGYDATADALRSGAQLMLRGEPVSLECLPGGCAPLAEEDLRAIVSERPVVCVAGRDPLVADERADEGYTAGWSGDRCVQPPRRVDAWRFGRRAHR